MSLSTQEVLSVLDQSIKKEFDANKRVLSFEEYCNLIAQRPKLYLRSSAGYLVDLMDHFGKSPIKEAGVENQSVFRFHLFDFPLDGTISKLVGHEKVQTQIYNTFKSFQKQGRSDRLVLLHGPNGSAKSTIAHAIMNAMERYSKNDEGANYSYSWIFPIERYTKGGIGLNAYGANQEGPILNYAHLPETEIAARLPSDTKDHPLLLIPVEHRRSFLEKLLGTEKASELWETMPIYLTSGDLSDRCKSIFETLLATYNGNLKKLLAHIQVERFYYSKRYRTGISTIEPQMHVDAQYHLLSYNKSVGSLPASLQSLNFFTLTGDLIDGNRGLIEYSDLLKRPVDSFKYLLSACESGSVNVGMSTLQLDSVMIGSTNEVQLDAFKEFPDFSSFKARFELIKVPYLLSFSKEKEIYSFIMPKIAGQKFVAPHAAWTAALWSVLTRLKKPNSLNFPSTISSIISSLTPIQKAKLYDTGEIPEGLKPEEKKVLKACIEKLENEFSGIPYYEGRMGASPREVKTILFEAASNPEFPTLSPLAILKELEEFIKKISEYDFLKQDPKDGYHDVSLFIQEVRNQYLDIIDNEVRASVGLYDQKQWEEFIKKYVHHLSHFLKKEKLKNMITGRMEDPDHSLIDEFEKIVGAGTGEKELESFRKGVISQIGAWSLDHTNEKVIYSKVFPDFWKKLEKHYYEAQKTTLTQMHDALLVHGSGNEDSTDEGYKLAKQTVQNMISGLGYNEECAKEVIMFLMRKRYNQ